MPISLGCLRSVVTIPSVRPLFVAAAAACLLLVGGCGGSGPPANEIVFVSTRDGDYAVYGMNADGSDARRVAGNATSGVPAWSPDGRRIAFRRYDGQPGSGSPGPGPSDLFVVNADGSGLRRLTRGAANVRWFAWSPDARTIAFLRNGEVHVVNADGSGERRLTQLDY